MPNTNATKTLETLKQEFIQFWWGRTLNSPETFTKFQESINTLLSSTTESNSNNVVDVTNECFHDKTIFQNLRCNVCKDCGEIIEMDV